MIRALAAAALLLAAPAAAQDSPDPHYDCTVTAAEGSQSWTADGFGVRWVTLTPDRALISAGLGLYSAAERAALQRHGPFDPALRTSIGFGPPTMRARKPLWVVLDAGTASLPPQRVGKDGGFYTAAHVPVFDLEPLLDAPGDLRVRFVLGDGTVVHRFALPTAQIKAAIARFGSLARDYEARVAAPAGQCHDRREDTVIVVT